MIDGDEQAVLDLLTKGWDGFLAGHGAALLETALPPWLAKQRWFGAKSRVVSKLKIGRWVQIPVANTGTILPSASLPSASSIGDILLLLDLTYSDGSEERYQLPLTYATGATLEEVRQAAPGSIVCDVQSPTGPAAFHDAVVREEFRQALLRLIEDGAGRPVEDIASASKHVAATLVAAHESRPVHEVSADEVQTIAAAIEGLHSIEAQDVAPEFVGHMPGAQAGIAAAPAHPSTGAALLGSRSAAFAGVRGDGTLPSRIGSAEQSNTNILYGQRMILKLFRRLQPGQNPDVEIGRFLTDVAHFPRIAPLLGELTLGDNTGESTTLAMLQGLVLNEGDGWAWTLESLAKYYQAAGGSDQPQAADYIEAAGLLGQRTAEMHLALATATDDSAFKTEPFTAADGARDGARLERQVAAALDALANSALPAEAVEQAEQLLALRGDLLGRARALAEAHEAGQRIRIHGDYHLGQILRAQGDFVLLDFEGEPAKSLAERRSKQSPLRDVAGMLRSFSYAANAALHACDPAAQKALAPWALEWERAVCASFLDSYRATAGQSATLLPEATQAQSLLESYLIEKALYELLYELNNRPAWVTIPLSGILALANPAAEVL